MHLNYAAVRLPDGTIDVGLYTFPHKKFMREVHTLGDVLYAIPFSVSGKTYQERKANLEQLAIDFQLADAEVNGGLSYGELADIGAFFNRAGSKLGLIREFRENGIPC